MLVPDDQLELERRFRMIGQKHSLENAFRKLPQNMSPISLSLRSRVSQLFCMETNAHIYGHGHYKLQRMRKNQMIGMSWISKHSVFFSSNSNDF